MQKRLLMLVLSLSLSMSHAQTRLIAHKSHSGSNKSFHKALWNGSITDLGFGEPFSDIWMVDSIITVSDSISIIKAHSDYQLLDVDTVYIDTIYHEAVKTNKEREKIVGQVRKTNTVWLKYDSVKYVGIERDIQKPAVSPVKSRKKKHEILPVVWGPEKPFNPFLWLWVTIIALISILTGVLTWKVYQFKKYRTTRSLPIHE